MVLFTDLALVALHAGLGLSANADNVALLEAVVDIFADTNGTTHNLVTNAAGILGLAPARTKSVDVRLGALVNRSVLLRPKMSKETHPTNASMRDLNVDIILVPLFRLKLSVVACVSQDRKHLGGSKINPRLTPTPCCRQQPWSLCPAIL